MNYIVDMKDSESKIAKPKSVFKKFYVAGSWENREAVYNIMTDLKRAGHTITTDWTTHTDKNKATEYALEDLKGVQECDIFLFCHDEHKTGGKNYELGYAHALGKTIIIYSLIGFRWSSGCVFVRGAIHKKTDSYRELWRYIESVKS